MKTLTIEQQKKRITNKYLKDKGVYCPFCRSSNLVAGETEAINGILTQGCYCANCDTEWKDQYKLVGISLETD